MKRKHVSIIFGILAIILLAGAGVLFIPKLLTRSQDVTFSKDSGFYENEFTLKLKARKGAVIYYTTDGTTPTEKSNTYKSPIQLKDRSSEPNVLSAEKNISFTGDFIPEKPVSKGNVIRAFAKFKDGSKSPVMTKTYFIGKSLYEKYKDIPVFSLSINPEDFYDNEKGIYVKGKVFDDWVADGGDAENTPTWEMPANFTQTGSEWERPVHVELFENGKATTLTQDMGVRIIGGASRTVEQKSFKLYARKNYGKGSVNYALFPGDKKNIDPDTNLTEYDTFVLRNGGNDSWSTKFRHRFIQQLVSDRSYCVQETRPCIVFLNGEYWGVYTATDDYSDNYIQRNYDIDKTNVVMYKRMLMEEGTEQDRPLYDDMIDFAKNKDLSVAENYEKISDMIDIQSLIDYFVTEIYIVNGDWLNHENNYRLWRTRTTSNKPFEDGKWRYMLYDTEYSMGIYTKGMDYNVNSLKDAMTMPEDLPGSQVILFSNLMKNDTFKQQFVTTFMDMVNYNFSKDRLNRLLDQSIKEYKAYMEDYFARFGNTMFGQLPRPMDAFDTGVEELKLFLSKRNDYIPDILKNTLDLKGNLANVTVKINNPSAGSITINTITPDLTDSSLADSAFTGQYFEDYDITLTAAPKKGYKFTGWSGDSDSTEASITVKPSDAAKYTANFKKK